MEVSKVSRHGVTTEYCVEDSENPAVEDGATAPEKYWHTNT